MKNFLLWRHKTDGNSVKRESVLERFYLTFRLELFQTIYRFAPMDYSARWSANRTKLEHPSPENIIILEVWFNTV